MPVKQSQQCEPQGGKQQPQPVQYQSSSLTESVNAAGYGAQEPLVVATNHQPHIEHGVPLYPEYDQNNAGGGVNASGGSKFTLQGYKDVWAAVLFVLLTLAIVGVGSYNFKNNFHLPAIVHHNNDPDSRWGEPFDLSTYILCAFLGAVGGLVLGIFSLGIFYCAPTAAIWLANIAMVALFCGIGLGLVALGANGGITLMLVGAVRLAIVIIYRKTIPLSAMMLQQATIIAKRHPMAIVLSFVTMLLAAVWCAFALATAYPTIRHSWHDSDFSGSVIGMFIFLAFTVYWCTQIAFNLGHVTFCGLTATWYFCGQDSMPSNPTLHSFKRASTTSFGSVCLGSLVSAITRTIWSIFRNSSNNRTFCGCMCRCISSCVESIMEMFNHFAYVYVAMYGTSYVESAKRTMQLVKTSAYLQLFNNMMIDGTLLMFQLVLSVLVSVGAFYITRRVQIDDTANAGRTNDFWFLNSLIVALIAGFSSLITTAQIFRVVDSTVTTLLVCLTEETQLIYSTNPEFGGKLANYLAEQQATTNGFDTQSMASRV